MKLVMMCAVAAFLVAGAAEGRTIVEMEKEISVLKNESGKLKRTPIVVLGSKQDNLSDEQKCATSTYNINLAQSKERIKYRTQKVITINPEYACPIHKCLFVGDHCPGNVNKVKRGMGMSVGGESVCCKAETKIGTSNFCNMGSEYDLSYRSWKLLKAKIPEGELQEARLREIDDEIASLRKEIKALQDEQEKERIARRQQTAKNKKPGKKK